MHLQKFQDEQFRQHETAAQVTAACASVNNELHLIGKLPGHALLSGTSSDLYLDGTYTRDGTQGLAESYADEAAGRAIQRQNVLDNLHKTVQHRLDSTAQQIAAHQALVDRQASRCSCFWFLYTVQCDHCVSTSTQIYPPYN